MATEKKLRLKKSSQSVRSRVEDATTGKGLKPKRRIRSAGVRGVKKIVSASKKHYYLPMPSTPLGEKLNKPRTLSPSYFRNAWKELKNVSWPGRRETWKLTFSVFIFAMVFGIVVALVDYGFETLFRKVIFK
jgi:preprotein translocase subunit SecE